MNVDVTGLATCRDQARIGTRSQREISHGEKLRRVPILGVALLAQNWSGSCQQTFEIRSMRTVTVHAVFPHRGVFEQERPTLFCMAAVAKLVHTIRLQQRLCGRAMRIVTVGAAQLALEQRHMGTLHEFRALDFVAGKAGLVHGFAGRQSV